MMRHFRTHINKGKLASFMEIEQCKKAEHPALQSHSLQNIRDFVRNRGITKKRQKLCFVYFKAGKNSEVK